MNWNKQIKGQYMNMSTFKTFQYMNGSGFSKARYMNGAGFEILARTPVPQLPRFGIFEKKKKKRKKESNLSSRIS